ncbi:quinon protein alcohol dehydrogenase-like superfamily [Hygrophoropsis aurantiaca]|uniref:Quinon protein alcohol dehydrogenase-like superfamily n=1 Tax=Hygrophoropsis aurantiaca TaxID=72124 RepID=A0ACB7ZVA7_9AGAM|nr:quinon protein alcohol dehydrogenase-like superfamily [Hygrophoropsis aurantiaca]
MSSSVSPKLEEARDQASRFPVKVFKGHTNETRLVASLKDGQRVVSGSNDGTIRIWDVEDVGKHETMTHGLWVRSISISSNEKRLVSGGNGATTMWDIETRAVVWKIDDANASLVAISPDGRLVAATSSRRTGEPGSEIVFLDAESGKHIRWLIHDDDLEESCLGFSPNGTRLAVGSLDGTVRLFDVVTGEMVLPFVAHEGGLVNALLFTHDGQQIITASDDRSIRVWDGATGQEVGEPMRGHTSYILEISLSPDGRRLASAAADRTVRVWDLNTRRQIGEPLQAQHKSLFLVSVAWSSGDGAYVVAGDHKGNVHLWTVPPLEDTGHVAPVSTSLFALHSLALQTAQAPVLDTSGPPRASTSRLRSNSVSSSILNLPAGSPPTPPQSRQLTTGPGEDDNWEYSTNDSFDSVLDLPADGNHRAQKRKRRRRRVAPITSTSSPPISVVPTNVSVDHNYPDLLLAILNTSKPQQSQALSAIINPPHRSPLDQTPNPPVQTTPDAHPVTDSPSLRVGALSRLWRKRRSPSRWTRRKTRKNHAKLHEGQPVQSSPAPNASANDIETQPQPTRATLPHHEVQL